MIDHDYLYIADNFRSVLERSRHLIVSADIRINRGDLRFIPYDRNFRVRSAVVINDRNRLREFKRPAHIAQNGNLWNIIDCKRRSRTVAQILKYIQ